MNNRTFPRRVCAHCHAQAVGVFAWRCACGGAFRYDWTPRFDPFLIEQTVWSLWRYAKILLPPGIPDWAHTSMGEGMTPIVTLDWEGQPVNFKLDYLMPTGSYKDRGSTIMLSVLRAQNHKAVIEDSSGNGGASVAAYASLAGLQATIFVPAYADTGKKRQIAAFGATLKEIEGPRQATSDACHEVAEGTIYASHVWHPAFLLGQMSAAYELWEQTGGQLPDAIVMPTGQGAILLGYYRGFCTLQEAGLIEKMPHLIAVQAAACAPIVAAWEKGAQKVEPVQEQETIAGGIRTASPARGVELMQALRKSQGFALAVDDHSIGAARDTLAKRGLSVEATSAVPLAALATVRKELGQQADILIPLSGTGLKESL